MRDPKLSILNRVAAAAAKTNLHTQRMADAEIKKQQEALAAETKKAEALAIQNARLEKLIQEREEQNKEEKKDLKRKADGAVDGEREAKRAYQDLAAAASKSTGTLPSSSSSAVPLPASSSSSPATSTISALTAEQRLIAIEVESSLKRAQHASQQDPGKYGDPAYRAHMVERFASTPRAHSIHLHPQCIILIGPDLYLHR